MKILDSALAGVVLFNINISQPLAKETSHQILWYDKPADATLTDKPWKTTDDKHWLSGLVLGNGSLGAIVFGDVNKERIQLNEESMWSGSVENANNSEASKHLAEICELLFDGEYKDANQLINSTQICKGSGSGRGSGANVPFGCFQTGGDLWIDFINKGDYSNYYRELDLSNATANITYTQDGINFKRECFVSYPDQVMVLKLSADRKGALSFDCTMNRPERFYTYSESDQLIMSGTLNDGHGGDGLHYMTRLKAVNRGGKVESKDAVLSVRDADEVTLFLATSTDYVLSYPIYKGRDYKDITAKSISNSSKRSYGELKKRHITDYKRYFDRVDFHLSGSDYSTSINVRLEQARNGNIDNSLIELFYQFGRYLLICSSRPGTLPANLQGIWANKIQTPWNGDYHTDINIQMNYWAAESSNLSELHLPYFDLMESFMKPARQTAKEQYNMSGWVIHPITNVWGFTSPGEWPSWGMHTGAAAWLCQHIGEHYRFTEDKEFLKRMYPILEGACEFYMDWLIEDPKTGTLISGPAVSPENTFITKTGIRSGISMGPTHDQQVIWQLFQDFEDASGILSVNSKFVKDVTASKNRLAGTKLGSDGRIMEWIEEFQEAEPNHRHISHLFAMHPGSQITHLNTPKLAEGAAKTIEARLRQYSDKKSVWPAGQTGWSTAWLVNQFARLHDGNHAKKSIDLIIRRCCSENFLALHPPFQIDANFGTTAGITEMLLQSHVKDLDGDYIIELLPALPEQWGNGSIKGLKARGGFEVDITWASGMIINAKITSVCGNNFTLKEGVNIQKIATLRKGDSFKINQKK